MTKLILTGYKDKQMPQAVIHTKQNMVSKCSRRASFRPSVLEQNSVARIMGTAQVDGQKLEVDSMDEQTASHKHLKK